MTGNEPVAGVGRVERNTQISRGATRASKVGERISHDSRSCVRAPPSVRARGRREGGGRSASDRDWRESIDEGGPFRALHPRAEEKPDSGTQIAAKPLPKTFDGS
ncbi:hypothetical protein CDD83_2851 [Cordyceps sp. RAO-2017]|nr:hypothetical protein CDD83_2851 [Cordyceps sp. RAO-2017]